MARKLRYSIDNGATWTAIENVTLPFNLGDVTRLDTVLVEPIGSAIANENINAPLTGTAYIDFRAMADGSPLNAETGEPTVRDGNVPVQGVVLGGALIAPGASGGAATGVYTGWRLAEDIQSCYADVSFASSIDNVTLIASADVSLASITNSALHVNFGPAGWNVDYYSLDVRTTIATGTFDQVPLGKTCRIGWRIDGNDIYVLQPNGVEVGPYTSAETTSRTNHSFIFEHFVSGPSIPGSKIYAAAANTFADPVAAGRVQLLTHVNDLSNAAWTKSNIGTITPGQPDPDGGVLANQVLENSATGSRSVYQTITKAASPHRYCQRFKAKPAGRTWARIKAADGSTGAVEAHINLDAVTAAWSNISQTFTGLTKSAYDLGDGWVQVEINYVTLSAASLIAQYGMISGLNAGSYVGDVTKGLLIYDEWLFERPL